MGGDGLAIVTGHRTSSTSGYPCSTPLTLAGTGGQQRTGADATTALSGRRRGRQGALASVLGPQKVVPRRLPDSIPKKLLGARTHVSSPSLPSIPPYPQTLPTMVVGSANTAPTWGKIGAGPWSPSLQLDMAVLAHRYAQGNEGGSQPSPQGPRGGPFPILREQIAP